VCDTEHTLVHVLLPQWFTIIHLLSVNVICLLTTVSEGMECEDI